MAEQPEESLRQLGTPIRRLVEHIRAEEADVYRHDPTEGSEARRELENGEQRRDGSPWGPDPVAEAQGMPGVRLFAADDHLNALSELVGSRHSVLGWAVACRNVLDASARAWWLLEPGLGARRRVARYFADWYQSVQFRGPLLSGLGDSEPERPEGVLDSARKLGLEVVHTSQGFHFDEEQVPHPAALVHDLLDDAGFDAGEGFYRYLSGTTHGDRQAILDVLQTNRNQREGKQGAQVDRVRLVIQITLTGYTAAVLRSWGYNGWDRGRVRELLKQALDATNV